MRYGCDVSVLITVYNQASSLEIVLKHIARQDYTGSWEIILCDDGSEEDSLKIIKDISRSLERPIRFIWQSRIGERRAASRNNALRCASGRIVILMDGDLAVPREFISRHVACHANERSAVYGSRRWLFLGDWPPSVPAESVVDSLLSTGADISSLYSEMWFQKKYANSLYSWLGCMGCNFSFIRDVDTILFDETFVGWGGEDQEFACRLHVHHGYDLTFVPSIFGLHLDKGSRANFRSVRPTAHVEIVQYLRNIVHFCQQYPQLDMFPIWEGLGLFEFDLTLHTWTVAKNPNFEREHIDALLSIAKGTRCR